MVSTVPTPLPKWQLTIVYAVQISEPISATVVYPFLPDFVRKTGITGGDETKTGYYSGIIGSAFFLAECLSVFHWGRASDSYGRRPVLLWGPLGLAIALLGFGLSSNFWWLVVLRAFQGIFNGNIGVSKTILAELTDSTNIGSAFAMMPIMWGLGNAIGPVMGGLLADPAQRWPDSFGKIRVFREYPYLLPCGVAALFSFLIFVCAAISLQETHPTKKKHIKTMLDEETTPLNGTQTTNYTSNALEAREMEHNPPSMREIITPTVVRTIVNYVLLAFLSMSYTVLLPLMYSTSIPAGGLGFTPYEIGVVLASWGFANAILQVCCMSTLLRRYGSRTVYIFSAILLSVGFVAFGFESFFARLSGKVDAVVLALMCIQFSSMLALSAGYASIQILIVKSVTNSLGLGSVNGLAQMVASGVRGLAPTLTSSLFSATLEHNLLGGFFVYAFILAISLVSIRLSFIIPKSISG